MAVPKHFRFTFRGVFLGGPEIWTFALKAQRAVEGSTDAHLDDINEDTVTEGITAFINNARIWSMVQLVDWRAYEIGTDGLMEGNGPLIHPIAPGTVKGTGTNAVHPPQVSVCVTTVAANRGPAKYGRFYIPGPATSVGSDGLMSVGDATSFATSTSALLKKISDAIDIPVVPASAACLNISELPAGEGTAQPIDHVECGRAYDTISRRRNKLLETRVADAHIDW